MTIDITPRAALTLITLLLIYMGDFYLYAWREAGPAPAAAIVALIPCDTDMDCQAKNPRVRF